MAASGLSADRFAPRIRDQGRFRVWKPSGRQSGGRTTRSPECHAFLHFVSQLLQGKDYGPRFHRYLRSLIFKP